MSTGIGFYNQEFFIIKSGKDLISESIMRILMSNYGERVNNPYFGVDLKGYLFELNDEQSKNEISSSIRKQIEMNEPRVKIQSIDITDEDNYIGLSISFLMLEENITGVLPVKFMKGE